MVVGHRGFISFLVDMNQVDFGNCGMCLFLLILASYFDQLTISSEIRSYRFANAEELEEHCYGVHKPQCENNFGPLLVEVPIVLEISDVGLMNKATQITRHKAGIGVEQVMCYVLDQTDEGYHPH